MPLDGLRGFRVDEYITRGLVPATDDITYNPYPHFGQASMWPRGYPLEEIGLESNFTYRFCSIEQASIRQAVVNGDPDVDAVFRLTRRHKSDRGNLLFDAAAPPIVIPHGTFVPFNSQNTMFASDAFWSLLLPTTVTFRACDIYRGYWAQALLWLVGGHLGFYPPNVVQVRNAHSFLKDLADETDMFQNLGRFVRFLLDWTCERPLLFDCMTKLADDMLVYNFLQTRDKELMHAWVSDLKSLGYTPPALHTPKTCTQSHPVMYFPREQNTSFAHLASASYVRADLDHRTAREEDVCSVEIANFIETDSSTDDTKVLLIVTIHNHADNILRINARYKRCFKYMIFCGTVTPDETLLRKWKISYVTMPGDSSGAVTCVKAASQMGYNVNGYMHVSDEMLLLSASKLFAHGTSHVWLTEKTPELTKLCERNATKCLVLRERAVNDLNKKLDTLDTNKKTQVKLKQCFNTLLPRGAEKSSFVEEVGFYVPKKHMKLFRDLADLFAGEYSHLAVRLLGCVDTQPNVLTGASQLSADLRADFVFPFLFRSIDTDNAVKGQYCKYFNSC